MIKNNYEVEVDNNKVTVNGDIGYYNIEQVERDLLNVIEQNSITQVEFKVTFDTSLVVVLCGVKAWANRKSLHIDWLVPDNLPILLKLYGVEEYFIEVNK